MDIDPLQSVPDEAAAHDARNRLNTLVAITVALLATFMGVCKVKDDNIVQAMQQAQADRIDHWSYYQAKNVREEVARAASDQLLAEAIAVPAGAEQLRVAAARYDSIARNEEPVVARCFFIWGVAELRSVSGRRYVSGWHGTSGIDDGPSPRDTPRPVVRGHLRFTTASERSCRSADATPAVPRAPSRQRSSAAPRP